MTKKLTFTLPIYWQQTTKKTVLCGMNVFRNWHYFTANKWKQEFHDLVIAQVNKNTKFNTYSLHLKIYYKNAGMDGSNVAALMEKVSLDALRAAGVIKDDNTKYHKTSTWELADKDVGNPRCVITIREITLL